MNKPFTNGRITRLMLLLQEFDITVLDKLGKENQVAYFLSRFNHSSEDVSINDNFPDENMFAISVKTPWFVDMSNYLAARKLRPTFHLVRRKELLGKVILTLG